MQLPDFPYKRPQRWPGQSGPVNGQHWSNLWHFGSTRLRVKFNNGSFSGPGCHMWWTGLCQQPVPVLSASLPHWNVSLVNFSAWLSTSIFTSVRRAPGVCLRSCVWNWAQCGSVRVCLSARIAAYLCAFPPTPATSFHTKSLPQAAELWCFQPGRRWSHGPTKDLFSWPGWTSEHSGTFRVWYMTSLRPAAAGMFGRPPGGWAVTRRFFKKMLKK